MPHLSAENCPMKLSTIRNKPKKKWVAPLITVGALLFWVGVWWLCSLLFDQKWALPSPPQVFSALFSVITLKTVFPAVLLSLWGIAKGYLWGMAAGTLLAALTSSVYPLHLLFSPLLTVVKATPIASFILILWMLFAKGQVPAYAVFLVVLPIVWANLEEGFGNADQRLVEMGRSYGFSLWKRIYYIYLPAVYPFFKSAALVALGMAWKAGIAAEVICTPDGTVGKMIFMAKRDLLTDEVFAWTFAVVAVCFLLEKLLALVLSLPYGGRKRGAK
jgi:NitT/TauT family transport system permease protein